MRIGGLASGMDTETMIRDLMKANRIPLDKITQKKQYLEWQLDDYRSVNRQLFDFSENTRKNMILSQNFTQKTVNISAPDDVAIRNLNSTSDFSGTIKIDRLATNATWHSGGKVELTGKNSVNSTLSDLGITGTSITINAVDTSGKMTNDAKPLTFDPATDTLKTVLDRINKETGVNAFFDSHTGKIAMTSKLSGEGDINVTGTFGGSLTLAGTGTKGQNAEFTFNGLTTQRSSNTFEINGFEFTLKASNKTDISFSSSPDTDKIYDSIVKYVDEYNKLIEDLNKQIREPKYRSFQPLSTEQKADMKEKEIELWEEKAKSGTLRNDPMISSMLTKMRTVLMESVQGVGLKNLGITTGGYQENGKLVINEKDLKAAISADPNKVHELFSKDGNKMADKGFARRLRDVVDESQKDIAARAGKVGSVNHTFTLGRNLINMDKQIESFETRLKQVESRYWKQFSAMEKAIQRSNSQYSYLANAFGGGMQ